MSNIIIRTNMFSKICILAFAIIATSFGSQQTISAPEQCVDNKLGAYDCVANGGTLPTGSQGYVPNRFGGGYNSVVALRITI